MTAEMWDKRYDTPEYMYGKEPNDFLRQHAGLFENGSVLSLAEGEGRNAVFLARTAAKIASRFAMNCHPTNALSSISSWSAALRSMKATAPFFVCATP